MLSYRIISSRYSVVISWIVALVTRIFYYIVSIQYIIANAVIVYRFLLRLNTWYIKGKKYIEWVLGIDAGRVSCKIVFGVAKNKTRNVISVCFVNSQTGASVSGLKVKKIIFFAIFRIDPHGLEESRCQITLLIKLIISFLDL